MRKEGETPTDGPICEDYNAVNVTSISDFDFANSLRYFCNSSCENFPNLESYKKA